MYLPVTITLRVLNDNFSLVNLDGKPQNADSAESDSQKYH